MLRVKGQHFGVICLGEELVPLFRELKICIWQLVDELIVKIEPVIHAVMSDDRYLGVDDGLDDQRETHFEVEELLLGGVALQHVVLGLLLGRFVVRRLGVNLL